MAMDVTKSIFNGDTQGFRVSVPPQVAGMNVIQQTDEEVAAALDALENLLRRRVLKAPPARKGHEAENAAEAPERRLDQVVDELLRRPLTPRRSGGSWANDSLANKLNDEREEPGNLTLSDWIDQNPELLALRYTFRKAFDAALYDVREDVRVTLGSHPAIVDYLIAYAVRVVRLKDAPVVTNFVLTNGHGAARVAGYATVSAARAIVEKEARKVPNLDDDDGAVVKDIQNARLPVSAARFRAALNAVLDKRIFDTSFEELINKAGFGALPLGVKTAVVAMMRAWQTPKVTEDNVKVLLPYFLSQVEARVESGEAAPASTTDDEADYDVELFAEDDAESVQISASAVRAAADLYGAMVLGDELDVFGAMDYFAHSYLLRRSMDLKDEALRSDLRRYVFSNKFEKYDAHGRPGEILDRTRPAERQMFYRQVFGQGRAAVPEGVIVNADFPRLWKLLMLESANYLERARESYDPGSYVSRENVVQAVEDLQYNLSTYATGLIQVVAPLVREELLFLKNRIFEHEEVMNQVLPNGGSWLQVVEALVAESRRIRPRAKVLGKKARLGSAILRAIAKYVPGSFGNDKKAGLFIGTVDAFITTQSILQRAAQEQAAGPAPFPDDAAGGAEPGEETGSLPAEPRAAEPAAGAEWDF